MINRLTLFVALLLLPASLAKGAGNVVACAVLEADEVSSTVTIACPIKNDEDMAIAGVVMEVIARSATRTVPWLVERVNLDVAGGIEPNEIRLITMPSIRVPEDAATYLNEMVWSVEILTLTDPDGNQIAVALQRASSSNSQEIADRIADCFRTGTLSRQAQGQTATINLDIKADGKADLESIALLTPSNDPDVQQLFEAARRAIITCGSGSEALGFRGPFNMQLIVSPPTISPAE